MLLTAAGTFASLSYIAATFLTFKQSRSASARQLRPKTLAAVLFAVTLHALFVAGGQMWGEDSIDVSFFKIGSLISLLICMLIFLSALTKPIESLGIVIFPVTATAILLDLFIPGQTSILTSASPGIKTHVLISITAYSLLTVAAAQSLLLYVQEWQLRHHTPHRFFKSLPPLQTMESFLFQMIWAGWVILGLSLLTGYLYLENIFAQHLIHKTVLAVCAWSIYSTLLWGRWKYGWRGLTAIRLTLSGFLFLMLAYFGSKMVLELILEKG